MIESGLVYIHSAPEPNGFAGCGALVEGPFIVTCRHVWQQASAAAADGAVYVCFPSPRGEGEAEYRQATMADDCKSLGKPPDLVILTADIPGPNAALPLARSHAAETGPGYALAGLRRDGILLDATIPGTIVSRINGMGLRQFTGAPFQGYWTDRGSSGSPLCPDGPNELAGILCLSETGKKSGEAEIHEAFALPATTIHRHLRHHVGREAARARGIAEDKVSQILDMIGAADTGIADISRRLTIYFDSVEAHAAERAPKTNNGQEIDTALSESRRLSAAYQPAEAMAVLDEMIAARKQGLLPLLKEKSRQQRLVFDHAGAARTLAEIAALDPDDFWNWIDLGDVHRIPGDREAALRAYRNGQRAAKRTADERDLSVSHNKIGDVLLAEGDRAGALEAYRAGLAIAETLAARDPGNSEWQRDLSISHDRIGEVLLSEGDRPGALETYRIGLAIRQTLAARDPGNSEWQRDLSISHNKVGDVILAQGNRARALEAYSASLAIRQTLAARDPGNTDWQRDLSVSHDRIGDVMLAQGDRPGALKAYRAGVSIAETLAARDPGNTDWQRDLSVSHNKIGDVLLLEGDRTGALEAYRAGLAIAETLAARDPGNTEWERDLSVSHERIGDVLLAEGNRAGALEAYRAGLAIAETLAARDPGNTEWQRDLSVSHNRIGDVLLAEGDRTGALEAYRAGLAIAETLAARDPGNAEWQRDLVVSNWKLSNADPDNRREWLERAKSIATDLAARDKLAPDDAWIIPELERRIAKFAPNSG